MPLVGGSPWFSSTTEEELVLQTKKVTRWRKGNPSFLQFPAPGRKPWSISQHLHLQQGCFLICATRGLPGARASNKAFRLQHVPPPHTHKVKEKQTKTDFQRDRCRVQGHTGRYQDLGWEAWQETTTQASLEALRSPLGFPTPETIFYVENSIFRPNEGTELKWARLAPERLQQGALLSRAFLRH